MNNQILNHVSTILQELNNSAVFAMSRGSRELFHTNFLAHILEIESSENNQEKYPYTLQVKKKIINQFFTGEAKPKNIIALRERKNFGLILIPCIDELYKVRELVVIEAKLKSIPTSEQLESYNVTLSRQLDLELFEELDFKIPRNEDSELTEKTYKINKVRLNGNILTLKDAEAKRGKRVTPELIFDNFKLTKKLLSPKLTTTEENLNGWLHQDWKEFLNTIDQNLEVLEDSQCLLDSLVRNYISSTQQILCLINLVSAKTAEFIESREDFNNFYNFIRSNSFRNARLHDLVGKVAYFKLLKQLESEIKDENEFNNLPNDFKFNAYTFYSRSIPGLVIQFKCTLGDKTSVMIGVQLQGDRYRHFIERESLDNSMPELCVCANLVDVWMRSGGANQDAAYGVFNPQRFQHLTTTLGNISYKDLKSKIIDSLNGALEQIQDKKEIGFINKLKGVSKN